MINWSYNGDWQLRNMVYGILIHNEQPTGSALVFIQWTNVCF